MSTINRYRTVISFVLSLSFIFIVLSVNGQSEWIIEATSIDKDNYYGETVANGMIGIVSDASPLQVKDVILNGVYDHYQRGRVSNILETFNPMNIILEINGDRINDNNIESFTQQIDMRHGLFETAFLIPGKAKVRSQMTALRHLPYTAIHLVDVEAKTDISVTFINEIIAPDHLIDIRSYFSHIDRPHVLIPLLTSVADSPSGQINVAASNSFIFEEPHGEEPQIIHEDWDYNRHLAKFTVKLKAGKTYKLGLVSSSVSSVHYHDPHNEAERLTIYAKLEGISRLMDAHRSAWDELWESDIEIVGQAELTKDIRAALYHLYAFARAGSSLSLSPMGLSGLGYNGHIFWDTELWMYPPLLIMQPDIARSLLDYRYERLEAAMQNAFAHGYKGAMFPWESSHSGQEDTPVWALTGPFQHHVTACIGWAFWKYYEVTQDKEWLRTKGFPVLREVAHFWKSRVEPDEEGVCHINNVIGANEYAENIDNNAFTNGIVKTVLRYATLAAKEVGQEADPEWNDIADRIPILKMENGVTKENATYAGEIIKQADVNLLSFPLDIVSDKAEMEKDLIYYQDKLDPSGPAMGFSTVATINAILGNTSEAVDLYIKSYQPNRLPPFGVLAETAGGTNPYFITGAGGMLQTVLSGFGGIMIRPDGIQLEARTLPKDWQKVIIRGVGPDKNTFVIEP